MLFRRLLVVAALVIAGSYATAQTPSIYVDADPDFQTAVAAAMIKKDVPAHVVTDKAKADYIFEPSIEEIVTDLIPKTIRTQLYKALLDSHASEHGARMTAMNKATDNAGEMLRDLRLSYNKARQAVITREILEIVGGAEALKG